LEFSGSENENLLIVFEKKNIRDEAYEAIKQSTNSNCRLDENITMATQKWQSREISNYEYLIQLNHAAYRSFLDLSQYPVFPWLLTNFKNEYLDINDPSNYRDLSKPIGALNPTRLQSFKIRYEGMIQGNIGTRWLYGTHYSAPGYVVGYLIRTFPLYMLKLHQGTFDKPDRLFQSIQKDWQNCYENHAIVKE
jgi:factor associated with neutral sphingomyelinase activation